MRTYQNFEFPYPLIQSDISTDLSVIVVIPSYHEPDIEKTLVSLIKNRNYNGSVEVIIILNESENTNEEISQFHRKQYGYLKGFSTEFNTEKLKFHTLFIDKIPIKRAGVGIARKIGMDEAYRRFLQTGNLKGIIACLDADTLVAENYFEELEKEAIIDNKIKAYSIYFEHECSDKDFAIIDYELHLRYYINMQRLLRLPFAYYTVGSAMAVKAFAYAEAFGMNKRQAGEDFYFLHKFIKTGFIKEINSTKVFPSARISDRVPFGTGKTIMKHESSQNELYTYNYRTFDALTSMAKNLDLAFYDQEKFVKHLSPVVLEFLSIYNLNDKIREIKDNSSNPEKFIKRFYTWFDAFKLMKYMHFARDRYFPNITVSDAYEYLARKMSLKHFDSKMQLLKAMREIDYKKLY